MLRFKSHCPRFWWMSHVRNVGFSDKPPPGTNIQHNLFDSVCLIKVIRAIVILRFYKKKKKMLRMLIYSKLFEKNNFNIHFVLKHCLRLFGVIPDNKHAENIIRVKIRPLSSQSDLVNFIIVISVLVSWKLYVHFIIWLCISFSSSFHLFFLLTQVNDLYNDTYVFEEIKDISVTDR